MNEFTKELCHHGIWAQFNPDDHEPGESLQELVNKCLK